MFIPCLPSRTSPAGQRGPRDRRASRRPARARPALERLEDRTVPTTGPATHFGVVAPANVTAGSAFTLTLSALDANGQVVSNYTGTVHFTASAGSHVLPADYTFTAGDGGVHGFNGLTLGVAGTEAVTADDVATPSVAGTASVRVAPAAATHFAVTAPASAAAGAPFGVTLTALDQYGNQATGYRGTVHFTSSDLSAVLPGNYSFTSADGGKHTFAGVTLNTPGSDKVTATDAGSASVTGSATVTVTGGVATHFAVSAPAEVTAGAPFSMTVTALDAANNPVAGYAGTVHFDASAGANSLPADYTFTAGDGGVHTFTGLTLGIAGTEIVTATDTASAGVTGRASVVVDPGAASFFFVNAPDEVVAGAPFSFTVAAFDLFGNLATGYAGTVHFSASAGSNSLPADYTFTAGDLGLHTFAGAVLGVAGTETLTATDTVNASLTGSAPIDVAPGAATHLAVGAPATAAPGAPFGMTATALDAYNNVATGYAGTVHFTSSDGAAVLPADYTFVAGDQGAHTFTGLTLATAGSQTVTAADTVTSSIAGSSAVNVVAANATHFGVSAPGSVTAGTPFSVTVTALDANGNPVPGYAGTVHFTASAGSNSLPADYTFTAGDGGVHTFTGLKLGIAGAETVTATDTATASITGSASVNVTPGAMARFGVSAPATAAAGTPFTVTVTAQDAYGNVIPNYAGTAHFTASAGSNTLPANYTFTAADHGSHTFASGVTLRIAGVETVTVTDTVTASLTGAASVRITPGAATHFALTAPAGVPAGVPFGVTVTALDAYGNQATGYTGTVHFASSDPRAALPADSTFKAGDGGKHTFTGAVLNTSGSQTLTVNDAQAPGIVGSAAVAVSGGTSATTTSAQLAASGPAPAALDQFYAQVAAPRAGKARHARPRKVVKKPPRHRHA